MSSEHDFDFFIGNWRVVHRRLKARLGNCADWEEFGGATSVRKLLGGQGNIDDNVIDLPVGSYRAATVRAFDHASKQWSIWWLDARTPSGLDTPMRGHFENGAGVFFANDVFEGRPIRVRFLWTAGAAPRWEQAFSADGGASWETNWTMDFTRTNGAENG